MYLFIGFILKYYQCIFLHEKTVIKECKYYSVVIIRVQNYICLRKITLLVNITFCVISRNIFDQQEDVVNNQEIVVAEYFHHPFYWEETCTPLTGLTIVLTTYSGSERKYLMHVAQIMGATVVDRYVKNMSPILICPKPEGAKYNGAIKWSK